MGSGPKNDEILSKLPARFYERIARDIPATARVRIPASDPIVNKGVLEGFSLQPAKFSRMLYQPPMMGRLRRELQTNKVFFEHAGGGEIVARINLFDPIPVNLPIINKLLKVAGTLSEIRLVGDPAQVEEAVRRKRRQIMERLYSQFESGREERPHETRFRHLEDFIGSGQSRRYDLFVDGYNVMLRVYGGDEHFSRVGFTQFREQFIEAVAAKSRYFAKVYLVFDGVEDSTDVRANAQVIYTDKTKSSADAVIIERITATMDKKVLLVTEDEGIISSVEHRIFALIDVVDFYTYLFE